MRDPESPYGLQSFNNNINSLRSERVVHIDTADDLSE